MHTETSVLIDANLATIYRLASEVERWPVILPHYRWVCVLADAGSFRVVEMAAHRDGFPVWWCAEQRCLTDPLRVEYRHVRGITRGMEVEWSFESVPDGVLVTIRHDLSPGWPVVGRFVADRVIGPIFVENIAGKTLRRIKEIAERASGGEPGRITDAGQSLRLEGSARDRAA